MQTGLETNWKLYRKDIFIYFLEKLHTKAQITIFILAH